MYHFSGNIRIALWISLGFRCCYLMVCGSRDFRCDERCFIHLRGRIPLLLAEVGQSSLVNASIKGQYLRSPRLEPPNRAHLSRRRLHLSLAPQHLPIGTPRDEARPQLLAT